MVCWSARRVNAFLRVAESDESYTYTPGQRMKARSIKGDATKMGDGGPWKPLEAMVKQGRNRKKRVMRL